MSKATKWASFNGHGIAAAGEFTFERRFNRKNPGDQYTKGGMVHIFISLFLLDMV